MSNGMTVEELAAATDKVKKAVHSGKDTVALRVGGEEVEYVIVNKAAIDPLHQMNAMAIAPIVNGKPDYNSVAVVYAGTNSPPFDPGLEGDTTAILAAAVALSLEYHTAKRFLEQTHQIVASRGGRITTVSEFSQSGGYLMKMVAEYGPKYGFRAVSFDDWGARQYMNLTAKERNWLLQNPGQLTRYQYESFAKLSGRDSKFGTVIMLSRSTHNGYHSKYFKGDSLDMDALIKDGLFGPGMTEAQVREAAKNWMRLNLEKLRARKTRSRDQWMDKLVKGYLDTYGSFGKGKFTIANGAGTVSLSTDFAVTGPAIVNAAIESLRQVKALNDAIPGKVELAYNILLEVCASQFIGLITRYDLEEEASSRGILPSEKMDLAVIGEVGQKIDGEISELAQLNVAVISIAAKRKALDQKLAGMFGF